MCVCEVQTCEAGQKNSVPRVLRKTPGTGYVSEERLCNCIWNESRKAPYKHRRVHVISSDEQQRYTHTHYTVCEGLCVCVCVFNNVRLAFSQRL